MQCKKCNAFIPDGFLYCPVCGEEVIIVSDFEIKLEDNIDMSVLGNTIELPEIDKSAKRRNVTKTLDIISSRKQQKDKINPKWFVLFGVVAAVLIVAIIIAAVSISRYFSYDYQYEKAVSEYSAGQYEDAIKTLKHLQSLGDDEKGKILLADSYIATVNYDAAIAVLYDALNTFTDDVTLYDKIVECYEAQKDFAGINELIKNANDTTLALRYSDYVSISPTFSLESGSYIQPDPIKLSAPGEGTIYYTTDGSTPTVDSLQYMGPIPLEMGENVISAMYINEKGILSDVVTKTYTVELDIPDEPVLTCESGTLEVPELIGVDYFKDYTVYYTDDGSNPDDKAKEYTGPLLMPLGRSSFSFATVNADGVFSKVVVGNYNLNIVASVGKDMAEYAISYQLMGMGEIVVGNSYKAEYGYSDGTRVYYIITEYSGEKKSGRYFAVDCQSGELFNFNNSPKGYSTSPL